TGTSEIGVFGGGHPVGERHPRVDLVLELRLRAVQEARLHDAVRSGNRDLALVAAFAVGADETSLFAPLNAGKEGGITPELVPLPVGKRVVVALGALQPDAEEGPRRAGREVLRLEFLGHVKGGGAGSHRA